MKLHFTDVKPFPVYLFLRPL